MISTPNYFQGLTSAGGGGKGKGQGGSPFIKPSICPSK